MTTRTAELHVKLIPNKIIQKSKGNCTKVTKESETVEDKGSCTTVVTPPKSSRERKCVKSDEIEIIKVATKYGHSSKRKRQRKPSLYNPTQSNLTHEINREEDLEIIETPTIISDGNALHSRTYTHKYTSNFLITNTFESFDTRNDDDELIGLKYIGDGLEFSDDEEEDFSLKCKLSKQEK
mmetsp:Transcript_3464/g.4824  ORF Transcript_3464/g.4824 Transcript_3464/m.4824 type:complete len:181 (+) Transcript_3464:187-729(+)